MPFGKGSTRRKWKHTKVKAGYRLEESCCVDGEHGRGHGDGCDRGHDRGYGRDGYGCERGDCDCGCRYDCGHSGRVHGDRVRVDHARGDCVRDGRVHGALRHVCDLHEGHKD